MKILIAGLGSIGRRHLKNLHALGEKDILLYRTHKSSLPDKELGDFPEENELEKAFVRQPDAVIISNPTSLHMPVAEKAARENVHIFIEKPISHTMDSVMPLEEVLQYSTSKVFTGYQFRFNPGIMKVKEVIERHEVGHPISFQCFWGEFLPGWHPWEDYRKSYAGSKEMGGGVVLTLSHPIDYLRWIFGEVLELFAVTGKISELEIDTEDMAEVLFTFENGVIGNLHLDYYSQPKKHDLVVTCIEGRVSWDYASSKVRIEKYTGEIVEIGPPQNYDPNQMFMDEMKHFLNVCNGAVQPICSFKDGKKALQIAWGILQSGKYKERVIFDR